MAVDADLRPGEREALLQEVRDELPLWLSRGAQPSPQPLDEVADLLRVDSGDLRRALAVHVCLHPAVQKWAVELPRALRSPAPATDRPREVGPAVRGPIDWPATTQLHSAGQKGVFATRPRRRTWDTPEHRALRWSVLRVAQVAAAARLQAVEGADESNDGSVGHQLDLLRRAVRAADRADWLSTLPVERPTAATRQRLARSRHRFIRHVLAPAVDVLMRASNPSPEEIAALLSEHYFVPERDWRLFEIVVLIRLDRALVEAAADGLRRRLWSDSGQVAAYRLPDGDEVRVRQQGWPDASAGSSRRQGAASRHGLTVKSSRPDIMVERAGDYPDLLVLECKASRVESTLGDGLSQLLGYLHERPSLFPRQPAGWLVPLPFEKLKHLADAAQDEPLHIVAADRVAEAVVKRMA